MGEPQKFNAQQLQLINDKYNDSLRVVKSQTVAKSEQTTPLESLDEKNDIDISDNDMPSKLSISVEEAKHHLLIPDSDLNPMSLTIQLKNTSPLKQAVVECMLDVTDDDLKVLVSENKSFFTKTGFSDKYIEILRNKIKNDPESIFDLMK